MTTPTELRTERLVLRPFRLSDVDEVLEYASDPLWAEFYPRPYGRGATEHMVARAVLESWDRNAKFAIVLKDRLVGLVDLTVDPEHQAAELGFDLARPQWGQGIAAEAAVAVIDWGFREYGLAKVYARADTRNTRSLRVMEKLGMTYEGTNRSAEFLRGERWDEATYSVLRDEWSGPAGPLSSVSPPPLQQYRTTHRDDLPRLTTARLTLRPFGPGDVDDVFQYARDPEWTEYLLDAVPQPYTRRKAEEFVAGRMIAPGTEFSWAIVLDGAGIGGIILTVDPKEETGEVHYALARPHWGRGLMAEAARAVVDWGFEELGLQRIGSDTDLRNRRSWRVMEKLGMAREGVLRSCRKDPRPGYPRIDVVRYSVLRQEWEAGGRHPGRTSFSLNS